jgi:hypothetical protein
MDPAPIVSLRETVEPLREWFNQGADRVRVLAVVSPT